MYEFWYDYVKRKYGENAKLCYMDSAYSSSLLRAMITRNPLPFFQICQILYMSAQIFKLFPHFCPFLTFICCFSEKLHACSYFLKWALMDTDSFNVHAKTDDICKNILKDAETRFDTAIF